MSLPAELETALCRAYEEEAERYTQAIELARDMAAAFQRGEADNDRLLQLRGFLDDIGVIEARIAEAKRLWQVGGQKPGLKLQSILNKVRQLIEELAGLSRTAETAALLNKEHLTPQMDSLAKGQQMQRAYHLWR